jgi:proline racemase
MLVNTKKQTVTLAKREAQAMTDAANTVRDLLSQRFVEHPRGEHVADVLDDLVRIYGPKEKSDAQP